MTEPTVVQGRPSGATGRRAAEHATAPVESCRAMWARRHRDTREHLHDMPGVHERTSTP
jgi:hypothetical protein